MNCIYYALFLLSIIKVVTSNTSTLLTIGASPSQKYTTSCGTYNYFKVEVPTSAVCKDLVITTDATAGEADLYVSKTTTFPTKDMETWAAYADGVWTLKISRWDIQSSPGWYYIGVYADCSLTNAAAVYTIKTELDNTDDGTDILRTPSAGANFALNTADSYKYFRFCLPDNTLDVTITLNNCYHPDGAIYKYPTSPTRTPCNATTYTLPELIVTRNIIKPTVADLGYKLATTARRNVTVHAADQAGNDPNGFHSGVYYVAVHAWCTPDAYCSGADLAWCGPCSYYSATPNMDVIVTTSQGKRVIFLFSSFPIPFYLCEFILTIIGGVL